MRDEGPGAERRRIERLDLCVEVEHIRVQIPFGVPSCTSKMVSRTLQLEQWRQAGQPHRWQNARQLGR